MIPQHRKQPGPVRGDSIQTVAFLSAEHLVVGQTLIQRHRVLLNIEGERAGAVDDAALLFARSAGRNRQGNETDHRVGLTIDGLYDTIIIEPDEVRSAPGADASDRILVGVVRRGLELIAILDATALLDAAMAAGDTQGERT